jgi:hypothetical protein
MKKYSLKQRKTIFFLILKIVKIGEFVFFRARLIEFDLRERKHRVK